MKPKVAIILNRLTVGGGVIDTVQLAFLLRPYFEVLLLYGEKEKDEISADFLIDKFPELQLEKLPALRRTVNPLVDIQAFFAIRKRLKSFGVNLVHTHGSKSGLLGRLAAKTLGVPVVLHTFHGHLFHSYFAGWVHMGLRWVERIMAALSTHIIVLSPRQYEEIVQQYRIVTPAKASIIALGVDVDVLCTNKEANRKAFRQQYALPNNAFVVASIGRVVAIKNQQVFLAIAAEIIAKHPLAYFFIVGDGDAIPGLISYLDKIGLAYTFDMQKKQANIVFTSWITQMELVYNGVDAVMITSLNEGTPLSIIEAQICGKPVVASNVGGVKDSFLPNESGFLVQGHEVVDYVVAIEQFMLDKTLYETFAKRAAIFAQEQFSKQKEVIAIKNLYLQLLRHKKVV